MGVAWAVCGIPTATAGIASVRLDVAAAEVEVGISTSEDFTSPRWGPIATPTVYNDDTWSSPIIHPFTLAKCHFDTLSPNLRYYYRFRIDGVVDDTWQGTFRAAPEPGEHRSFTAAWIGCNRLNQGPLHALTRVSLIDDLAFVVHLGDMTYRDPARSNWPETTPMHGWLAEMDRAFTIEGYPAMLKAAPFTYVPDDHEVGNRSSKETNYSAGVKAWPLFQRAWRAWMPIENTPDDDEVYHAFTWARTRWVLTDTRGKRDQNGAPDGPTKSMLGGVQTAWLCGEIDAYQADSIHDQFLWCSATNWWQTSTGQDGWGNYQWNRREIANRLAGRDNDGALLAGAPYNKRYCLLQSDVHAIQFDDGQSFVHDFSDGGSFPTEEGGTDADREPNPPGSHWLTHPMPTLHSGSVHAKAQSQIRGKPQTWYVDGVQQGWSWGLHRWCTFAWSDTGASTSYRAEGWWWKTNTSEEQQVAGPVTVPIRESPEPAQGLDPPQRPEPPPQSDATLTDRDGNPLDLRDRNGDPTTLSA
jgi:hypothetical protein